MRDYKERKHFTCMIVIHKTGDGCSRDICLATCSRLVTIRRSVLLSISTLILYKDSSYNAE